MEVDKFKEKVKRNVAENFDRSHRIYQAFEEKHQHFSALALKLAESIDLVSGSAVLDVGCGNGISAMVLNKHHGCSVLGIDLSPKMVLAGRLQCAATDIRLVVGDGENLVRTTSGETFDYVLYNASIFIFPDVEKTIDEAFLCLREGGKIAFSYYPQLIDDGEDDLLAVAFRRLGAPAPRFRVITDYSKACQAVHQRFGNIRHHRWEQSLRIEFMQDFFTIPAQSASLFPGYAYSDRCDMVRRLFATLEDVEGRGRIVWRMAESSKFKGGGEIL